MKALHRSNRVRVEDLPGRKRAAIATVAASALAALVAPRPAQAASATWTGASNGNWEAITGETNWSTGDGTFPGDVSGATTNTDVATFNTTVANSNVAINSTAGNASSLNLGAIGFSGSTLGNYTIGSTSGNALVMTSNASQTSTPNQIFISGSLRGTPTTAVTETINAPIVLAPQSGGTAGFYVFQNNSTALSNGDALIFNGAMSGGTTTAGATLTLRGANTNLANALSGAISNGGAAAGLGVTKNDAGTWTLSGSNSYSGATTVTGGTLLITGSNTGNGNYVSSGGTLDINTTGTVQANSMSFTGPGTQTIDAGTVLTSSVTSNAAASNGRTLNLNGGNLQVTGGVGSATGAFIVNFNGGALTSGNAAGINFEATTTTTTSNHTATVRAGGANLDTTIGNITSTAIFNGTSAGAINIKGGHTFTSAVTNNGLLSLQNNSSWDLSNTAGANSAFVNSSVGGLSGNGSVVNSGATDGTLTVNFASTAGPFTYSGNISPATTSRISLIKNGGGTEILSGANSYTGPTSLNAGGLLINGSLANTAVTDAAGATLGGSGSIGGATAISGTLTPGATAVTVGKLTFTSSDSAAALDLSGGGTYLWDLGALKDDATGTAGSDFDQVDLTGAGGNLKLGGSSALTLNFLNGISDPNSANPFWSSAHAWTLIAGTGVANAGDSNFSTLTDPTWSDGTFSTAADSAGNVVLSFTPTAAVPEPASLGLAAIGALGLLARRRRK